MKYFYSPSTNGLYTEEAVGWYENPPKDLVEITLEEFTEFTGLNPWGKQRGWVKGKLAWVDQVIPPEVMRSNRQTWQSAYIAGAQTKIQLLQDAIDLDIAEEGDAELLLSWKKFKVYTSRVDLDNPDWPLPPEDVDWWPLHISMADQQ